MALNIMWSFSNSARNTPTVSKRFLPILFATHYFWCGCVLFAIFGIQPIKLLKSKRYNEAKLIELAKTNPRYFGPLYERYHAQIFRFVYSRVRDRELTADLTSQTFTKALLAIKRYEDRGFALSTWLCRIAMNEVNMYFRQKNKQHFVDVDEGKLSDLAADVDDDLHIDSQILVDALNQLEYEHVELIELRFFEKRSFSEIGKLMGLKEDAAKMRVYRALNKLKALVQ